MPKSGILPDFSDLNILVVGDVMIDRYLYGRVTRISPEAPVPVLDYLSEEDRPGGAANVAANLNALGAQVCIISITGDDEESEKLSVLLKNCGISDFINIKSIERHTTIKTRVMSGSQQLLRIDKESKNYLSSKEAQQFLAMIETRIRQNTPDGIILQDYNKGLLSKEVIAGTLEMANRAGIPTFVDPKTSNFFEYKGCTVFKPNKKEISEALQKQIVDLESLIGADGELRSKLQHKLSFITLSADGIFISDGQQFNIIPTVQRSIADVCGAGDTVLSIITLCYLKQMPLDQIAFIANIAGGQVCSKPGVVAVDYNELNKEISMLK